MINDLIPPFPFSNSQCRQSVRGSFFAGPRLKYRCCLFKTQKPHKSIYTGLATLPSSKNSQLSMSKYILYGIAAFNFAISASTCIDSGFGRRIGNPYFYERTISHGPNLTHWLIVNLSGIVNLGICSKKTQFPVGPGTAANRSLLCFDMLAYAKSLYSRSLTIPGWGTGYLPSELGFRGAGESIVNLSIPGAISWSQLSMSL